LFGLHERIQKQEAAQVIEIKTSNQRRKDTTIVKRSLPHLISTNPIETGVPSQGSPLQNAYLRACDCGDLRTTDAWTRTVYTSKTAHHGESFLDKNTGQKARQQLAFFCHITTITSKNNENVTSTCHVESISGTTYGILACESAK
jgi:hypothetical protein